MNKNNQTMNKIVTLLILVFAIAFGAACYLYYDCRNLEELLEENPTAGGAGMSQTGGIELAPTLSPERQLEELRL